MSWNINIVLSIVSVSPHRLTREITAARETKMTNGDSKKIFEK